MDVLGAVILVAVFVAIVAAIIWSVFHPPRKSSDRIVLPRGRSSDFTGPTAQTLSPPLEGRSPMSELKTSDITCEEWREYEFGTAAERAVYRIQSPATLYHRPGGTTHRVVDAEGIAHCLPAPGEKGCVLRWKSKDPAKPVAL